MTERYALNADQIAVLRALGAGIVELSPVEVAVAARLLPHQAHTALAALERLGLASSWIPVTGRTGERLFVLSGEGQSVFHALSQFRGTPPVGAIVRLPRPFPSISGWRFGQGPSSYVEIVSDQSAQ